MRKSRWLCPWKDSAEKPAIYHVFSRVVDKRMVLLETERERFRMLMRMVEKFSGCRALSYCMMSNHFHILLEVPPMPAGGIPDDEFGRRLGGLYNEAAIAETMKRLTAARAAENAAEASAIRDAFLYRMHNLSEFMKTLLQRFTRFFNGTHQRSGTLWEERYKSVIVEDGTAARAVAAYIDLNPVRAGIVTEPADYRWSSYGEAIGGGSRGSGKTARAGLVRAMCADRGTPADASYWAGGVAAEYRKILMRGAVERTAETVDHQGNVRRTVLRRGTSAASIAEPDTGEIPWAVVLRCRVRHFTAGAVIGSRSFVNDVFASCRDRFGPARKDGARRLRGAASPAAGVLWTARDLRKGVL